MGVGKVVGIFSVDEWLVWYYLVFGVIFVVVGVDIMLFVCVVWMLVVSFKDKSCEEVELEL